MMRLSSGRIRLFAIGAASAPCVALIAVRVIDPFGGPAVASADTPKDAIEAEPDEVRRAPKPTSRERDAAGHILLMASEPTPPTPFYYAPGSLRDDALEEEPVELVVLEAPTPAFDVTAILSGSGSPIAVINGKALRVGQEIVSGWTLTEVREAERAVIVTHDEGRTARVPIRQ